MRHISPKEMVSMLEEIPVSCIMFRKPESGSGVAIELLSPRGDNILISEPGTPDPVLFTSPEVIDFFRELGLFSGAHDDLLLDASSYRPAGFGFLKADVPMTFGQLREKEGNNLILDDAKAEAVAVAAAVAAPQQSQVEKTVYVINDMVIAGDFSMEELTRRKRLEVRRKEQESEHHLGENYLTTINLLKMTIGTVILQLLVSLLVANVAEIRQALYIGAGALIIMAFSTYNFERRYPEHPSLRIRKYLWLSLIAFVFTMGVSFFMGMMFMM